MEGWAVSAFVRNPDKVPAALRSKVTLVKGDLRNAASGWSLGRARPSALKLLPSSPPGARQTVFRNRTEVVKATDLEFPPACVGPRACTPATGQEATA